MTAPVQVGEVIAGKYEVEREIGQGGMGVVVAAMHRDLNQRVAIKLLRAEGTPDPDVSARFFREARAAVKLRSEHVAKVLDVGKLDNNSPFIVMEYLEGDDLGSVLKQRERLDPAEAVGHILQACEALAEAHAAGIVHRDLKPENLFLTRRRDGSPSIKVLDFGISKMVEQGATNLTTTGSLMGTPFYMSPEQLRSSRQVDGRSDIWALGIILYQLLTGKVAFLRPTLPELCAAVLLDETVPPKQLRPDLPDDLDRAICRCLEKAPEQRFPSLAEFTAAIAPFTPSGTASAQRVATILDVKIDLPATAFRASTPPTDPLASTNVADGDALPVRVSSPSRASLPAEDELPALPVRRSTPVAMIVIPAVIVAGIGGFLLSRTGSSSDASATTSPASHATSAALVMSSPPGAASVAQVAATAPTVSALPQVAVVSAAPAVSSSPPAVAATSPAKTAIKTPVNVAPTATSTGRRPADFGTRQLDRMPMPSLRPSLLVIATLLTTSLASADVSPGDRAAAEALFDSARQLTAQDRYAEACPKYEESNRLDPAVGTRLYLADCYEHVGRFASAWITFREAAAAARSANQLDREKKALALAAALEPRLSRIALQIPKESDVPGLVIKRDGTVLGRPLWDTPTPVDPGAHTIEASAPGRKPWSLTVDLKDQGQTKTITVPALPPEAAPVTSARPVTSAPVSASPPPPPPPPMVTASATTGEPGSVLAGRTPALIAGGVGVVGLVVGTVFAVRASSKWSDAKDQCPGNHCTDRASYDDARSAKTSGNLATGFFAAGLVGLGAGVVLWFTASPSSTSTGRYIAPTFVAGGGGLTAGGSW